MTVAKSVTGWLVTGLAGDAATCVLLEIAVWVSGDCRLRSLVRSVAVIVASPGVVELVIVAEYAPPPSSVVALTCSPGSLDENTIESFGTGSPLASATVATAVLVEAPFAGRPQVPEVSRSPRAAGGPDHILPLRSAPARTREEDEKQ